MVFNVGFAYNINAGRKGLCLFPEAHKELSLCCALTRDDKAVFSPFPLPD